MREMRTPHRNLRNVSESFGYETCRLFALKKVVPASYSMQVISHADLGSEAAEACGFHDRQSLR
jgi:hypothetical protein